MANQPSQAPSANGLFVTVKKAGRGRSVKATMGNITVSGTKPSAELVKLNVARSSEALERVGKKLIKPGVRLPAKKGVPHYSADEDHPDVMIRVLDGQTTRGRLLDGQFVESK